MEHLVAAEGEEAAFSGQLDADTVAKYSTCEDSKYAFCVGCGACICAKCLGNKFSVGRIDVDTKPHPKRQLSAMSLICFGLIPPHLTVPFWIAATGFAVMCDSEDRYFVCDDCHNELDR